MQPLAGQRQLAESLKRAAIFAHLSADQLAAVARRSHAVKLAAGQPLFTRGSPAEAFFLLLRGQIKLYRTSPEGHEVIIEVLEPGATFGETRVFLENPRFHVSCNALVDSEVVAIEAENFRTVLSQSVDTCLVLLRNLSRHAETLVDEVERLALQNGISRVAGYLLGQLPPGRNEYVLKVPKGVLATRLAIRGETLSRILKQLAGEGIVSVSGQNIVHVHSREKLQRLALQAGRLAG
jgi:CRP-like cAMP-binding protein